MERKRDTGRLYWVGQEGGYSRRCMPLDMIISLRVCPYLYPETANTSPSRTVHNQGERQKLRVQMLVVRDVRALFFFM